MIEQSIKIDNEIEKIYKIISLKKNIRILDYCKENQEKFFFFFALNTCTGAHNSQIRVIKIEDIDLKEMRIRIKSLNKDLYCYDTYFFPKGFRIYLEKYIFKLDFKTSQWLFPSKKDPKLSMSKLELRYHHRKISEKLGFHFTPNDLRIAFRINFAKNCYDSDVFRELRNLNDPAYYWYNYNESNKEIGKKNTRKYEINDMQAHYDKYFPYYSLKYFKI